MLLIEKLEEAFHRLGLARPLADTDANQDALLPSVIISCTKLKDVADKMRDYVGEQLSPENSAIMSQLLHHGCRHMGNALAACWYDPEGNSEAVIEYLVSSCHNFPS